VAGLSAVRKFLTLAGLTALASIRQPIFLLLTTACVVLTAVMPLVLLHQFGEDGKMVRDSGLAFQFVFGLFAAGHAACAALSGEVRGGTAVVVLSKPVGRSVLLLAKFAGLVLVIAGFSACAAVATLLSERVAEQWTSTAHATGDIIDWQTGRLLLAAPFAALALAGLINYRWRRPFETTAFFLLLAFLLAVLAGCGWFDRTGHPGAYDLRVQWRILPASFLVALALVVLAAIAISLSTRLGVVPTLTLCMIVFVLGLLADHLAARGGGDAVTSAVCALIPNWQNFWAADALSGEGTIPGWYVKRVCAYAASYSAAVLALGMLSFRSVDL